MAASTAPSWNALPAELQHLVFSFLPQDQPSLRPLRVTCRSINEAIEPLVYDKVAIGVRFLNSLAAAYGQELQPLKIGWMSIEVDLVLKIAQVMNRHTKHLILRSTISEYYATPFLAKMMPELKALCSVTFLAMNHRYAIKWIEKFQEHVRTPIPLRFSLQHGIGTVVCDDQAVNTFERVRLKGISVAVSINQTTSHHPIDGLYSLLTLHPEIDYLHISANSDITPLTYDPSHTGHLFHGTITFPAFKVLKLNQYNEANELFKGRHVFNWTTLSTLSMLKIQILPFLKECEKQVFPSLQYFFTDMTDQSFRIRSDAKTYDRLLVKFLKSLDKLQMVRVQFVEMRRTHLAALSNSAETLWSMDVTHLPGTHNQKPLKHFEYTTMAVFPTVFLQLRDLSIDLPEPEESSHYEDWFSTLLTCRNLRRIRWCGDQDLVANVGRMTLLPAKRALIGPYMKEVRKLLSAEKEGVQLEVMMGQGEEEDAKGRIHRYVEEREFDSM